MQLSEHEKAHNRNAFKAMRPAQKIEYVFAYYKLPLVLVLVAVVTIGSVAKYYFTHKEPFLYVAYTNVDLPDEDDQRIFGEYPAFRGKSPRTSEVYRYYGLYLSDPEGSADHQISYASRLKLLATIDAQELDVVLMSQESYDLLSHSGYLLDLDNAIASDAELGSTVKGRLVSNDVIISDNEIDYELGQAEAYEAETESHVNAIEVSDLPAFAATDLTGSIYLGIIANTPRLDEALELVRYLAQ